VTAFVSARRSGCHLKAEKHAKAGHSMQVYLLSLLIGDCHPGVPLTLTSSMMKGIRITQLE